MSLLLLQNVAKRPYEKTHPTQAHWGKAFRVSFLLVPLCYAVLLENPLAEAYGGETVSMSILFYEVCGPVQLLETQINSSCQRST